MNLMVKMSKTNPKPKCLLMTYLLTTKQNHATLKYAIMEAVNIVENYAIANKLSLNTEKKVMTLSKNKKVTEDFVINFKIKK